MENFEYFEGIKIPLKLVKICGLWHDKSAKKSYKAFGWVLHVIGCQVFLLCQLIYAFQGKSLLELSDVLSVLFTYLMLTVKSLRLMFKVDKIVELFDNLKALILLSCEIEGKPLMVLKARDNQVRMMFKLFWATMICSCLLGGIAPFILYMIDPKPPYKVSYRTWSPFNHENNVYGFFAVAIYEFANPMFFCGVLGALDMFMIVSLNSVTGLLQELSIQLGNISFNSDKSMHDENSEKLKKCIEVDLKIKVMITKTQKIFSPMIFMQATISLFILCTTAFKLSQVNV